MPRSSYPRVRAVFLRAVQRLGGARIDLAAGHPSQFPADRDFAYTTDATRPLRIVFAPKLEEQPLSRIEGVILHELGHAYRMLRGDNTHAERTADRVAERLFGVDIRYDAARVQTTGRGRYRRRPASLPQ